MARKKQTPQPNPRAEAGRKGGKATVAKHGRDHMRAIGRKGFEVTCNRHYGGDRRAMLNALIRRGLRAMDPCPWNGAWQNFTAFPDPSKKPEGPEEPEEDDPVVAQILRSIRSAPIPGFPL